VFPLATKDIKLQFSGYAIFAAKIVSVATGFFFQFMLARAIDLNNPATSPQYGIYFNINDLVGYFVMMGSVFPFWAMRYFVRGKEGAVKTGLAMTAILSIVFATLYLGIISLILPVFDVSSVYLPIYFIAVFQVVEMYFFGLFETCLQAQKPQAIGYGLIIQQLIKIALGYVLIVVLAQPLLGAVLANVVSFGIHLFYYANLLRPEFKQRIQWGYVKEWARGSVATIYSVVGTQLAAFIYILLFWYGGEDARGIYGGANFIAYIITFSSFLSFALYPKLLAERKSEDITTSLKMTLMFAIPMTVGGIALADSYMMLLTGAETAASPGLYQQGYIVLSVLAFDALITVLGGLLSSVVLGLDTVDLEGISVRQLVKSKMFRAYSLAYVQAAITIPLSFIALTTFAAGQPLLAALSVCLINTSVHVVTFAALYLIARGMTSIVIPWRNLAKYIFASAAMGAVLYLVPHPTKISTTLVETAVGGLIYAGIILAIDREAREIPKGALGVVKSMLRPRKKNGELQPSTA
jgi:hypothetical protein